MRRLALLLPCCVAITACNSAAPTARRDPLKFASRGATVDRQMLVTAVEKYLSGRGVEVAQGPRAAGFTPVYLRRPHFGADSTAPTDSEQNGVHRASDLRAVLDLL